jgi:hypothetical protein
MLPQVDSIVLCCGVKLIIDVPCSNEIIIDPSSTVHKHTFSYFSKSIDMVFMNLTTFYSSNFCILSVACSRLYLTSLGRI